MWFTHVHDGIVNEEIYKQTPLKILWILKEVNTEDPSKSWSVSGWLNEDNWTDEYRYWKRTYTKLLKVTHAILNQAWQNGTPVEYLVGITKKIAYINIKKIAGKEKSFQAVIDEAHEEDKEMLLKQIEAILNKGTLVVLDGQDVPPLMGRQESGIRKDKGRIVLNYLHLIFRC